MPNVAIVITIICLLANIPLGYYRKKTNKLLLKILYIHIHVPLIFVLRQHFGLDIIFIIPFAIGAVAGQFVGGYYYKRDKNI